MSDWRDIATAPTDGSDILLYWRVDVPGEGQIISIDMCFFDAGGFVLACECNTGTYGSQRWQPGYTHWMPLPDPPVHP